MLNGLDELWTLLLVLRLLTMPSVILVCVFKPTFLCVKFCQKFRGVFKHPKHPPSYGLDGGQDLLTERETIPRLLELGV